MPQLDLSSLYRDAPVLLQVTDSTGQVLSANGACLKAFSYTEHELLACLTEQSISGIPLGRRFELSDNPADVFRQFRICGYRRQRRVYIDLFRI